MEPGLCLFRLFSMEALKRNQVSLRSATAHTQASQAHINALTQNAEVNKLFWSGVSNRAGLDLDQMRRFDGILAAQLMISEQAWRFKEEGVIDEATWASQRAGISWIAQTPGFADYWKVWGATHHPGFAAVIAEAMSEAPRPSVSLAVELATSSEAPGSGSQS